MEGARAWTGLGHRKVTKIASISPLNVYTVKKTGWEPPRFPGGFLVPRWAVGTRAENLVTRN